MNSRRVAQARTESLPESRLLLHGLGLLNVELGHTEDARDAFLEFCRQPKACSPPEIKKARSESEIVRATLGVQDPR